ncbi:MAG: S1C family serine protease [Bacillota bacterium]
MTRSFRRLTGFLAALLLSLTLAASAAAQTQTAPAPTAPASPLELKVQELEKRLQALERMLALSSINVPALVEKVGPSVVSLYQVNEDHEVIGEGSGFLWKADGKIITNAHVVDEFDLTVMAKFSDGKVLEAKRVMVDNFLDFAILDVEGTGYPVLRFAQTKPRVGEPVVVIGNAFGYSNSVSFGIVSGVDRRSPYHAIVHYPSLQTDAAINHGNSGGPILNAAGEVVAIATWTEGKDETDGIAFGIPADQIAAALRKMHPEKGVVRPWLGISAQEPYWARGGLPNDLGLMITDMHAEGAAAKAGLKPFDYIMKVNGVSVNYLLDLRRELEKARPGDTITLTVERLVQNEYQEMSFQVVAGEYSQTVEPLIPSLRYDTYTDDLF